MCIRDSRNGAPCVLVARYFQNSGLDSVVFDDLNGGHLAARHLLSLGHRDILFLGGPECVSSARERREGFMAEIEMCIRDRLHSCYGRGKSVGSERTSRISGRNIPGRRSR